MPVPIPAERESPGSTGREDPAEGPPTLSGVVVHWHDADHLASLASAWPRDRRYELIVVDNSASADALPGGMRLVRPGSNLGFAGGANRGVSESAAPLVLILNADAMPMPGAVEALVAAFSEFADAAGIVPALYEPDGRSQHRWQLRPLPSPLSLLGECLGIATSGPAAAAARGAAVAQPAAAALALRRDALLEVGGFDESFHPAWFEDVDLARRLCTAQRVLRYEPRARFVHHGGSSVPRLGYGPFLWIYHRNLERYARRHHGAAVAGLVRVAVFAGAVLRLGALPLRRPRRATSRAEALRGLWALVRGAASGWRLPDEYAARFAPRQAESPP